MTKQPMTPAGVQALLKELYALSATDLQAQANQAYSDFRIWISTNFTLTVPQAAFLAAIDSRFIRDAGAVTSTAISAKLAVSITIPTPPGTFSSKYIIISQSPSPQYDSVGGYTVTGAVVFQVAYK